MTRYSILAFCLVISKATLAAGDTLVLTLNQCVDLALRQNLALKISANEQRKSRIDFNQAKWAVTPEISAYSQGNLDLRRSTNQNNQITPGTNYTLNYGISASLNVFNGFIALNRIAAQKYFHWVTDAKNEKFKHSLYLDVVSLYFECLLYNDAVSIARDKTHTADARLEHIIQLKNNGLRSQSAITEAQADVSNYRLEQLRAENAYRLKLMQLAQLLEIDITQPVAIKPIAPNAAQPVQTSQNTDSIYLIVLENYPAIQQKELELMYYQKISNIKAGTLSPNLSLFAGTGSSFYSADTLATGQHTSLSEQFSKYLNPSVGVRLGIPIFSGFSRTNSVRKSRIDVENAILALELERKNVYATIESAIQQQQANLYEYQMACDHLQFESAMHAMYREKSDLGLITSIEFSTEQNRFAEAQMAVQSAKYAWWVQNLTIQLMKTGNYSVGTE